MEEIIKVSDLKREFYGKRKVFRKEKPVIKAIDGISFEVKKGEIFGLLGQNGAG